MQEKLKRLEGEKEKEAAEKEKFDGLKTRLKDLLEKDWKKINDKMIRFSKYLKNKYDDYDNYALYYVLNSPIYKKCNHFDFPDDDSIEKYIERLGEEQKKAEDGEEDKE